jgi:hypothetical protein
MAHSRAAMSSAFVIASSSVFQAQPCMCAAPEGGATYQATPCADAGSATAIDAAPKAGDVTMPTRRVHLRVCACSISGGRNAVDPSSDKTTDAVALPTRPVNLPIAFVFRRGHLPARRERWLAFKVAAPPHRRRSRHSNAARPRIQDRCASERCEGIAFVGAATRKVRASPALFGGV